MNIEWISCHDSLPELKEDYYAFMDSENVLVFSKSGIDIGYLRVWEDEDYESQWKESGRDGYEIEEVTHWAFLPEPPVA